MTITKGAVLTPKPKSNSSAPPPPKSLDPHNTPLPVHFAPRPAHRTLQTTSRFCIQAALFLLFVASIYSVFFRGAPRVSSSACHATSPPPRVHELEMEVEALREENKELRGGMEGRNGRRSQGSGLMSRPGIRDAIMSRIDTGDQSRSRLSTRILPLIEPESWRQHSFSMHGAYGFLQYSGYRAGPARFVVVGLALITLNPHRILRGCYWTPRGGGAQSFGTLTLYNDVNPLNLEYEAVVLHCHLTVREGDMGVPRGGHLVVQIDNEDWVAFGEDVEDMVDIVGGTDEQEAPVFTGEYDRNPYVNVIITHLVHMAPECVPNVSGAWQKLFEFIEYHRVVHNTSHFYLYDAGGVDNRTRAVLERHVAEGVVTVTDLRGALLFSVKQWGQPLTYLDCIQRTRYSAKWVFIGDMDEYIHVVPPSTMASILAQYEGRPYLTHGAFDFNTSFCDRGEGGDDPRFAVERLVTWDGVEFCLDWDGKDESTWSRTDNRMDCVDWMGHRKYFFDPRQVIFAKIHTIPGVENGVHLNASTEVRHFHYRGVTTHSYECKQAEGGEALKTNDDLVLLARGARKCPLGSPENCFAEKMQEFEEAKVEIMEDVAVSAEEAREFEEDAAPPITNMD